MSSTEGPWPETIAGDAGALPWPPWLENLAARERIRAIVGAVVACYSMGQRGHDEAERRDQHCTASMAEVFLAKMLTPDPGQISLSREDLQRLVLMALPMTRDDDKFVVRLSAAAGDPR